MKETETQKAIEQEAEELYPFDDPRKNMHHDNQGQRSRRAAYIAGRSKSLEEKDKEIERLKGLIEKAYQAGEDGMIDSVFISAKGDEILYSQAEIDRFKNKFKLENNL